METFLLNDAEEAFLDKSLCRLPFLSVPVVRGSMCDWKASSLPTRVTNTSPECVTGPSKALAHEGEIHPQTIATHLLTRLFDNHSKASFPGWEEYGVGCFQMEERHSWVRFHSRMERGQGGACRSTEVHFPRESKRETQFGPEGKQLQIMHLHGNKTIGPAHVIIPYKYRRRGRAKLTFYHLNWSFRLSQSNAFFTHTQTLGEQQCTQFCIRNLYMKWANLLGIFMSNYGFCRPIYIISILGKAWDWRKWCRYIFKRGFQLTGTQFWSPLRNSACTSTFSGHNLKAVWNFGPIWSNIDRRSSKTWYGKQLLYCTLTL